MEPKRLKILLFEDYTMDADYIRKIIDPSFDIVWVDYLSKGIEVLKKGEIDAVLLDLHLPDGQGIGNIQKIMGVSPQTAVIILTGSHQDEEMALEAIRSGAQDYIYKDGVDYRILSRVIHYAVERKRTEVQLETLNEALKTKIHELEVLNRVMMDREKRILELKEEIQTLKKQTQSNP